MLAILLTHSSRAARAWARAGLAKKFCDGAKHSPSTSGVGLPCQTLEQLQDREKYSRAHNLLALISQFKVIVVNYFIIGKYNLVYFVASPHSSVLS